MHFVKMQTLNDLMKESVRRIKSVGAESPTSNRELRELLLEDHHHLSENCCAWLALARQLKASAEHLDKEARSFREAAKSKRALATRLREQVARVCVDNGVLRMDADFGRISCFVSLEIDDDSIDLGLVPEEYTKTTVEISRSKLKRALRTAHDKGEEVPGASLRESPQVRFYPSKGL